MAQSTSTLLQATNDVLLGIGERPITNFGSNLGAKVKSVITTATLDVGFLDDWSWLITKRNADGWNGNVATLNNRRRVYDVQYRSSVGQPYVNVPYVFPETFDNETITGYSASGTYPLKYTLDSELSVFLNPYPTTTDEQIKIFFRTADVIVPPVAISDKFPVPERFVELIKKRALYYLALRHLDDAAMASMFNSEYEVMAQRLRDTERSHAVGALNMYRRR
jgi:hypothetical protein